LLNNPLSDLVMSPIYGALLGVLTGWLTSLNARPFRILAEHPWRVFWLWGVPPMMGIVGVALLATLLGLGVPLDWPPPWYFLYSNFLYLPSLVMALGAIQGLRVT